MPKRMPDGGWKTSPPRTGHRTRRINTGTPRPLIMVGVATLGLVAGSLILTEAVKALQPNPECAPTDFGTRVFTTPIFIHLAPPSNSDVYLNPLTGEVALLDPEDPTSTIIPTSHTTIVSDPLSDDGCPRAVDEITLTRTQDGQFIASYRRIESR